MERSGGGPQSRHFLLQLGEGIGSGAGADGFSVAADFKLVSAGDELAFRAAAENGVASAFLVLFGRLEKKGGLIAGDFGEGGDGCFVCDRELGPHRDDAVSRGEGGEFVKGRMDRGRRHEGRLL